MAIFVGETPGRKEATAVKTKEGKREEGQGVQGAGQEGTSSFHVPL